MRFKNLFERIQDLKKLTPSEAKIADFLQRSQPRIVFETATSIGQNAGVSKATVVRFLSRLGYLSFAEFRKQLQLEIQERLDRPIERFRVQKSQFKEGLAEHLRQNIADIMRNLQEAHHRIKPQEFTEAVRTLALGEGTLYVAGNLSSFGLAYLFWLYACYLRDRVVLLSNLGSTLPIELFHVNPKDVLFVITHRRYSRQTQLVVEQFVQKGGRIIMLSDAEVNPYSHLAHLILVAPSETAFMFDSSGACLAVLESLLSAMAHLLEPQLYDRFESSDRLLKQFHAFTSSPLSARKNKSFSPRWEATGWDPGIEEQK